MQKGYIKSSYSNTVDGRNLANQLRLAVYHMVFTSQMVVWDVFHQQYSFKQVIWRIDIQPEFSQHGPTKLVVTVSHTLGPCYWMSPERG